MYKIMTRAILTDYRIVHLLSINWIFQQTYNKDILIDLISVTMYYLINKTINMSSYK